MQTYFNKISLVIICIAPLISSAQFSTKVIDSEQNPNEPTIAIQPSNSDFIVASSNNDNFYYSIDGGTSWTKRQATSAYGVYGDPVLHYAGNTLFFAHLSKTEGKNWGDWFDRIVVQKITDPVNWIEKSYSVGYNNDKMQDKPWITSDDAENLYVTWTEFDKYGSVDTNDRSRILFSKYSAASDSFTKPVIVSDITGNCLDGDSTLEGATLSVGNNDELYLVWAGYHKIWMDISTDGGKTWNKDIIVATQNDGWDLDKPNISRSNGMPFCTYNKKAEQLLVCYTDGDNTSNDENTIKLTSISWKPNLPIQKTTSTVSYNSSAHQYFPNMITNSKTGKSYVAYFDTRNSKHSAFYDIYLTEIGNENNIDLRITSNSIPLPGDQFFFGDYIDLDLNNNLLAIIYPKYDISKSSSIELFMLQDIDSFNILQWCPNPDDLKPQINAIQKNDSIYVYANGYNTCTVKCKLKRKKGVFQKKYKYSEVLSAQGSAHEILLGVAPISEYKYLKYRIKEMESKTVYSRSIFLH